MTEPRLVIHHVGFDKRTVSSGNRVTARDRRQAAGLSGESSLLVRRAGV